MGLCSLCSDINRKSVRHPKMRFAFIADKIMDIVQQKYTLKHNTVAEHVLGMRVTRHDKGILLDSTPAIKRLIEDFENKFGKLNPTDIPIAKGTVVTKHKGTKTDKPYRNLLGGLSHYSNTSVPEILF